jgi:hypothetical protein
VLWGTVGYYGVLWVLWGTVGVLWGTVGCCGVLWGTVGYYGVLWSAVGCCGVLWGAVGYCGVLWWVLWGTVGYCGVLWVLWGAVVGRSSLSETRAAEWDCSCDGENARLTSRSQKQVLPGSSLRSVKNTGTWVLVLQDFICILWALRMFVLRQGRV